MKKNILIMQEKDGQVPAYTPEDLVNGLENLRRFITGMAAQLDEKADISARELASALMPLDYLLDEVDYSCRELTATVSERQLPA